MADANDFGEDVLTNDIQATPQLPAEGHERGKLIKSPPDSVATLSGELLPLAIEVYRDLMLNGKNEKVRLDAANAVSELNGLKNKATPNVGFTFNLPPEYLKKSMKALAEIKLGPQEGVIDV